ncbi:MAG: hypothetical protein ACD_2C00250G0003 [uncultured bacterium (gcode 4)]|uniref:Uncharacterized protein n=1 Tax=uncultured bacterium (gcode 4) TaxID=1234023 RepID=K2FD09_9BACT|nr:MAG: hypothetical protein ACD_2C00250G0003 [uncultured bacterium (gcode 4)]
MWEKNYRFNPDLTKAGFSWALADSQERRNSRPTPDQVLAPFITKEIIAQSIREVLEPNDK